MEGLNEIKTWLGRNLAAATSRVSAQQGGSRQVLFKGNNQHTKLAAAQKLAQDTGRELHRVELSKVVSKYIGETEKNLKVLFEKAANKNAILFFDEADALFGKRTDIKDAHDQYANQEVSYLLQKLETYQGLVILSLNAKTNVDEAFIRRLRYVVEIG